MKKLVFLLLSLTLFLVACGGGETAVAVFDETSPWEHGETLVYSIEHYRIERQSGNDVEDSREVLARGAQTVTTRANDARNRYFITTDWYLDFECGDCDDTDDCSDNNCSDIVRDTIITSATIMSDLLRPTPTHSTRTVITRRKVASDGYSRGDINPNLSHQIITFYDPTHIQGLTSTFRPIIGEEENGDLIFGTVSERTIPSGRISFDNESLFFVVRALRDLGNNRPIRFDLNNMFDFHRNGIMSHPISVTSASDTQNLPIGNLTNFVTSDGTSINGEIETYAVQISLATQRPGQPIRAWYAVNDYYSNGNRASKLLIEYYTHTIDFSSPIQTRIRYRLINVCWCDEPCSCQ